MGKPNIPLVKRPPEIPWKTPGKRLAPQENVNVASWRTKDTCHLLKPTCQESLTKHNTSKEKREHDQQLSRDTKTTDSLHPGGPYQTHNPHPPSIPTIQNPHPIQSSEETLQDLDKRLEIRLRNIVTSTLQDNNLDITKTLFIQLNMLRFQQ